MTLKDLRNIIFVLCLALFATACDSDIPYDEDLTVDEKGWHMDDKLVFNMEADDTSSTYLCCFDIRNSNDYPYSNIYLHLTTVYPDGAVATDTNIQFQLAQPDGQWLGRYTGRYVDGRYPFCFFHFPQKGSYQFIVSHAMRDTLLPGVKNIGITVMNNFKN